MEYMEARIQDQYDGFEKALDFAYEHGLMAFEEEGQLAVNPYISDRVEIWKAWELGWLDGFKASYS